MHHRLAVAVALLVLGVGPVLPLASVRADQQGADERQNVALKRQAQERSLAHTLASVGRARAAGRPDILTAQWDRAIQDERSSVIEAGGPGTWEEQVRQSTCAAQVVSVGTAIDRQSFLTQNAQFILSDYTIRVDAVLRGDPKASGGTTSYVRPGGAVMVKGKLVTARHSRFPALEEGSRYIIFADQTEGSFGLTVQRSTRWSLDLLSADPIARAIGPDAVKALQEGVASDRVVATIKATVCGK
ncbi:MAG: hypothetical protein NTV05_15205 [Acidobacteria bacterium]|nr:hypothetical protein [Acidobacteriota bacterium]